MHYVESIDHLLHARRSFMIQYDPATPTALAQQPLREMCSLNADRATGALHGKCCNATRERTEISQQETFRSNGELAPVNGRSGTLTRSTPHRRKATLALANCADHCRLHLGILRGAHHFTRAEAARSGDTFACRDPRLTKGERVGERPQQATMVG